MYIQSNHSVVASVHVFWFLSFCMFLLFCWTEGAAGLPPVVGGGGPVNLVFLHVNEPRGVRVSN